MVWRVVYVIAFTGWLVFSKCCVRTWEGRDWCRGFYDSSAAVVSVAKDQGDRAEVEEVAEETKTEKLDVEQTVEPVKEPEVKEPVSTVNKTPVKKQRTATFSITAYCPCYECSEGWGRQTATGKTATAGRTIAVDPKVIPYGTEVLIDGKSYIAEDCGGGIKGNKIDLFFDTHEETVRWGRRTKEVTILY